MATLPWWMPSSQREGEWVGFTLPPQLGGSSSVGAVVPGGSLGRPYAGALGVDVYTYDPVRQTYVKVKPDELLAGDKTYFFRWEPGLEREQTPATEAERLASLRRLLEWKPPEPEPAVEAIKPSAYTKDETFQGVALAPGPNRITLQRDLRYEDLKEPGALYFFDAKANQYRNLRPGEVLPQGVEVLIYREQGQAKEPQVIVDVVGRRVSNFSWMWQGLPIDFDTRLRQGMLSIVPSGTNRALTIEEARRLRPGDRVDIVLHAPLGLRVWDNGSYIMQDLGGLQRPDVLTIAPSWRSYEVLARLGSPPTWFSQYGIKVEGGRPSQQEINAAVADFANVLRAIEAGVGLPGYTKEEMEARQWLAQHGQLPLSMVEDQIGELWQLFLLLLSHADEGAGRYLASWGGPPDPNKRPEEFNFYNVYARYQWNAPEANQGRDAYRAGVRYQGGQLPYVVGPFIYAGRQAYLHRGTGELVPAPLVGAWYAQHQASPSPSPPPATPPGPAASSPSPPSLPPGPVTVPPLPPVPPIPSGGGGGGQGQGQGGGPGQGQGQGQGEGQQSVPPAGVMQYSNEVYQQLPAFRLLRGEISPEQYFALTGRSSVIPALGNLEVPGPRELTWRLYSQLLMHPSGLDILRSLWQAANRDFDVEGLLARSYAPLGSAVEPTLIRYG